MPGAQTQELNTLSEKLRQLGETIEMSPANALLYLKPPLFYPVTGHPRPGIQPNEPGNLMVTAFIHIKAASMEHAARGKVYGSGNLTLQLDMLWFLTTELRNGTE